MCRKHNSHNILFLHICHSHHQYLCQLFTMSISETGRDLLGYLYLMIGACVIHRTVRDLYINPGSRLLHFQTPRFLYTCRSLIYTYTQRTTSSQPTWKHVGPGFPEGTAACISTLSSPTTATRVLATICSMRAHRDSVSWPSRSS